MSCYNSEHGRLLFTWPNECQSRSYKSVSDNIFIELEANKYQQPNPKFISMLLSTRLSGVPFIVLLQTDRPLLNKKDLEALENFRDKVDKADPRPKKDIVLYAVNVIDLVETKRTLEKILATTKMRWIARQTEPEPSQSDTVAQDHDKPVVP